MSGLFYQELESQFTTPIPDAFIADKMPGANGNYVKVYLCAYYGYFHRIRGLTMSKIARKLHMLESEVIEALKYWHQVGAVNFVYHQDTDQYSLSFAPSTDDPFKDEEKKASKAGKDLKDSSVSISNPVSDPSMLKDREAETKTVSMPKQPAMQKVIRVEHAPTYSPDELAVYAKQPLCQDLFQFAANLLGAPLSSVNASTVLGFYDFYRLPMDVIKFMMEHAVKNGHRSLRYMEKIALDWSENEIHTIPQAEEYVNRYAIYWPVMRSYGQNGSVPDELLKEYVDRWKTELNMSEDLIVEAAKRTYEQLHKASYPYTNSILENWAKNQIRNLSDVSKLDEDHASSFRFAASSAQNTRGSMNNYTSSGEEYDYDALAKESMERLYAAYGDTKENE